MDDETEMIADISASIMKHTTFYEDALQPGMRQVGVALETIGKSVNVALSPISGLIWGYDRIEDWLREKVAIRLLNIEPDQIQQPDVAVAVPTIEALRYLGDKSYISDMFANLLAASMAQPFAKYAHPAFVDVLRQMNADEAKMMSFFADSEEYPVITAYVAPESGMVSTCITRRFSDLPYKCGCEHPLQGAVYMDNLVRLGLLEYPPMARFAGSDLPSVFDTIRALPEVRQFITDRSIDEKILTPEIVCVTAFGADFIRVCVPAKLPPEGK